MRIPPLPADFTHARVCKPFCEKYLTLPRERVHRLCTRAGMLESFLVCPGELTDDQVMELLKISFRQPEVVLALAKMVHDVHERSNVQNPLE